MKFLLVDDEQDILDLVSEFLNLKFDGAEIETVTDGIDAVISVTEKTYDVIITDHKMEKMNGAEFVYNMRNMESSKNKNTPTIILSGYIPLVKESLSEDDKLLFMDKPFEAESLIRKIRLLTGSKSS